MPLSNYDEIKASIKEWTERDDYTDLNLADFIHLAEVDINHLLRVREMEERAVLTTTPNYPYVSLPDRFIEFRPGADAFSLTEGVGVQKAPGVPVHYTIIGEELMLYPTPDKFYEIPVIYYAETPHLSDEIQESVLTKHHPDILLSMSLAKAWAFSFEEGRAIQHRDSAVNKIQSANRESKRSRIGPTPRMSRHGLARV